MNILAAIFAATSIQLNLPPGLLSSLCYVETRHNVSLIHYQDGKTNSYGICQIKLESAEFLGFEGNEEELMEPATNIYYAGLYLQHQLIRYNNDIPKAVIAYNRGSARHLTYTNYQARVFKQWRQNADYAGN